MEIAKECAEYITEYGDPERERNYQLDDYIINEIEFELFVSIGKQKVGRHKYYSIYYEIQYAGGDNLFTSYTYTGKLREAELADILYSWTTPKGRKVMIEKIKETLALAS